jgi:hypothetical protein
MLSADYFRYTIVKKTVNLQEAGNRENSQSAITRKLIVNILLILIQLQSLIVKVKEVFP